MASALTRAGRFYREALGQEDDLRRHLDALMDAIWDAVVAEEIDPSRVEELGRLPIPEDGDPRYPYQDEHLSAIDLFLSFLLDRELEQLEQSFSRLLDLWNEAGYDDLGLSEYTRANDERVWATDLLRVECGEQVLDLSTLASTEVSADLFNGLRSRAQSH